MRRVLMFLCVVVVVIIALGAIALPLAAVDRAKWPSYSGQA